MEMFLRVVLIILILTPLVLARSHFSAYNVIHYGAAGDVYDVTHYGAAGDGKKDDTDAFVKAWEATCKSSSSNSTMHIPSGKTFLVQPMKLDGPCKSTFLNVEINGNIIAPERPSNWNCYDDCDNWIFIQRVNGLSIYGNGTIDGRGHKWWKSDPVNDFGSAHHISLSRQAINYIHPRLRARLGRKRPTALKISDASNVLLSGLHFKNNPRMHVVLDGLQTVHVSHITIDSPEDSPNTDGIHVTDCRQVRIHYCQIGTGDDCISIVNGASNIKVDNVICGPGHGISIGSLGKHGATDKVEQIQVSDVVFNRSTNGARIKTWQGGKGYARHITFERVLSIEADNPIIINQFYCDHERCTNHKSAVQVSDVTFRQFIGTSRKKIAVKIDCSESAPCKDITMDNIYLLSRDDKDDVTSFCNSAHGVVRGRNVPRVSCLDHAGAKN